MEKNVFWYLNVFDLDAKILAKLKKNQEINRLQFENFN